MSAGLNRDFGRVLIIMAVILLGIFLTFDLYRPDSLVRSWFGRSQVPQRSQPQELIDALRRSR